MLGCRKSLTKRYSLRVTTLFKASYVATVRVFREISNLLLIERKVTLTAVSCNGPMIVLADPLATQIKRIQGQFLLVTHVVLFCTAFYWHFR